MAPDEKRDDTIRIGFVDYNLEENLDKFKTKFDVVCTDNTSFTELEKVLKYNQPKQNISTIDN